jgi:hypothetical protein
MTIPAFDVDSLNKPINFSLAFAQGRRGCYIKLGGSNLSGNDPYLMTSNGGYSGQMNAAVAAGFQHRGSYWMSGGHDPVRAAQYYIAHRDPRTTFDVLDNERIDAGNLWSDAEADAFFAVLAAAGCNDLWMYGSRLSTFATQGWPRLIARGVKALVADYGNSPLSSAIVPSTYPASLVKGHQYTSSASIGGIANVDADVFTDDAFSNAPAKPKPEDDDMLVLISTPAPAQSGNQFDWWVQNISDKTYWHVENVDQLTYLRKIVTPNGTGMEVHENEPVSILAGFTLIPTPAAPTATVAIDAENANIIGTAVGAAIKFPGYKATTEVVPS